MREPKKRNETGTESGTYRVFDMGRWKVGVRLVEEVLLLTALQEAKVCLVCRKEFTWRKKWERSWAEVTTCSERCKAQRKKNKKDQSV